MTNKEYKKNVRVSDDENLYDLHLRNSTAEIEFLTITQSRIIYAELIKRNFFQKTHLFWAENVA
tara:strand:+ start:380 stop:571 length:192 start_codon:yes stop_codon:yes gene_type:complete